MSRARKPLESFEEYRANIKLEDAERYVKTAGVFVWNSDAGPAFRNPNQDESFYLSEVELVERAEAWRNGR